MLINDINKTALIVWGTKRGKSVFFSSNLLETNEELNNQLKDIQLNISFQRIDHDFYSFDFTKDCKFITIIRSLNDALGRVGYLAISMVIDASKTFRKEDDLVGVLKILLDEYVRKYVISDYTRKTINAAIREDVLAFEVIIKNSNLKLEDEQGLMRGQQQKEPKGVVFLNYEDEEKLKEIIKHFDREELRGYERVLVLPEGQNDLTANISFTTLAPVKKKIHYKFKFFDEQDNLLYDVICVSQSDRRGLNTFTCDAEHNEICEEGEQLNLKVEKKGYITRVVSAYDIMSNAVPYDRFSVLKVKLAEQELPVNITRQTELRQKVGNKSSSGGGGKRSTHQGSNGPSAKKIAIAIMGLLLVIFCLVWLVNKISDKPIGTSTTIEDDTTTDKSKSIPFDTASMLNKLKGSITVEYQLFMQNNELEKALNNLDSFKRSAEPFKEHKNYLDVIMLIDKYENQIRAATTLPDPDPEPYNIIDWKTGPFTEAEFNKRYSLVKNVQRYKTELKNWLIKNQRKFHDLETIKNNNSDLMVSWGLKPKIETTKGNEVNKKRIDLRYSPADLEKMLKENKDEIVVKWWKENCINMKPDKRREYTERIRALKKAGCN